MIVKYRFAALVAAALGSHSLAAVAQPAPARAPPAAEPSAKLTKAPKLRHFVAAEYPPGERAVPGAVSVLLELSITADGRVEDATVIESGGEAFDQAALQAAKRFEFEPAEIDGSPAAVRIKYRYDFAARGPEGEPKTGFFGVVRDKKTGQPLVGVKVTLDSGESSVTDQNGHFSLPEVQPGTHSVTLAGAGFTPIGTEETLEAGKRYDATYDIEVAAEAAAEGEQADFEMVVTAPKLEKSGESTTVNADQGTRVAGTGGDAIKVVENLPGVARSTVGSGQLVVWGAGAADTRVYVDGVHIPVLYHEGGYRSVVHSDLVRSVELQPGGYGAPYGRGLGGLVTIGLRPLQADGYHGSVALDAIDAAASVRGSVGDKVRFAAAARRSHLDWVLRQATTKDVGEFVPIPQYWDAQARLAWVPHDKESVELGGLLSSDHISRSLVEADPADTKTETKDTGFGRLYATYRRVLEGGDTVTLTPYVGTDRSRLLTRFGAVPAELVGHSTVYGFRGDWHGQATDFLAMNLGLDFELTTSSYRRTGSVTTPPREGDIRVFGQQPDDQVNADQWTTSIAGVAPFAEADFSLLGGELHVAPGIRFEPTVVSGNRIVPRSGDLPAVGFTNEDTFVEPRMAVRWRATSRIMARAAVGVYHQPPLGEDLSAVFGNPKLGDAKAMHYLIGGSFQLSRPITVEITSFLAEQSELVTRSPLPSPVQAQALVQGGLGRAYGTQFLLRHDPVGRLFGWVSYSIIRSERTDGGSRQYRPFDFDQTHVFTALASYDLGAGFEVGGRFRYASGYPRTPVMRAVYDARIDAYQPVFGAHNSIRIPDFYQLDARASKRFKFGESTQAEIYLDVQNVTNRKNPEEIVYNFNYTQKSYITGLPILPVLGGKFSW
jgi:TonB family protein